MKVVRLAYLVDREGGWGSVREWGETLSLGAQGEGRICIPAGPVLFVCPALPAQKMHRQHHHAP